MYIDIHTHQKQSNSAIFHLQNIRFAFDELPSHIGNYSIGLHPWDITNYDGTDLEKELVQAAQKCNAIAIGEIGLDRNCKIPFDVQQAILDIQLKVARQLDLPVILHCVKAYPETLALLQKNNIQSNCIFHGFNKNWSLATLLLEAGCWLSFGKALLTNRKLQEVFVQTPLTQLFLETDDTNLHISTIYQQAATLKNIHVEELQNQLYQNLKRCFQ